MTQDAVELMQATMGELNEKLGVVLSTIRLIGVEVASVER